MVLFQILSTGFLKLDKKKMLRIEFRRDTFGAVFVEGMVALQLDGHGHPPGGEADAPAQSPRHGADILGVQPFHLRPLFAWQKTDFYPDGAEGAGKVRGRIDDGQLCAFHGARPTPKDPCSQT